MGTTGRPHTRDLEDVVAWLAQQMAKTPIAGLLRIGWDTVVRIVERVVAEHLDESRLARLVAIGVDEISYRRGQRYLTSVVDHASGAIVWCAAGRNAGTLQAFVDELGAQRRQSIRAVSIDMSGGYAKAIRASVPDAESCFDPFHVVRLAQRAVDQVRRDEWNAHERSHTPKARWIKSTRWSLLKAPDKQTIPQQLEDPALAPAHLDAWLAWASRSRLEPFVSSRVRSVATARASAPRSAWASPTARLEGLNSRIRLISHRSFRLHSAAPLIALVYLCCGRIVIDLPR